MHSTIDIVPFLKILKLSFALLRCRKKLNIVDKEAMDKSMEVAMEVSDKEAKRKRQKLAKLTDKKKFRQAILDFEKDHPVRNSDSPSEASLSSEEFPWPQKHPTEPRSPASVAAGKKKTTATATMTTTGPTMADRVMRWTEKVGAQLANRFVV